MKLQNAIRTSSVVKLRAHLLTHTHTEKTGHKYTLFTRALHGQQFNCPCPSISMILSMSVHAHSILSSHINQKF